MKKNLTRTDLVKKLRKVEGRKNSLSQKSQSLGKVGRTVGLTGAAIVLVGWLVDSVIVCIVSKKENKLRKQLRNSTNNYGK